MAFRFAFAEATVEIKRQRIEIYSMRTLERPETRFAGISAVISDLGGVYVANGVTAFVFSATGPVAIVISVGLAGGLSESDLASWIFGAFVIGGLITLGFSLAYRQPLGFAWTIPGSVLLATALDHLSFAEVIGAFWATGALMAVIGLSGSVRKGLESIPMPIVMGMVCGIFLQFGLDLVSAFEQELWVAAVMVAGYICVAVAPRLSRVFPPAAAALATGVIAVWLTGSANFDQGVDQWIALPNLYVPEFSRQALFELVIPLAVSVLVVQNGQGYAVLSAAGHRPPINSMTVACGLGSMLFAAFGAVCTCVTGPSNAVLSSQGELERQYAGAIVFALLLVLFGIFASAAAWLLLSLPYAFIAVLGGLALLPVLQRAFVASFSGGFTLGALVAMLVTVSDISIWNIGSPCWGLVFGFAASGLLERDDFRDLRRH